MVVVGGGGGGGRKKCLPSTLTCNCGGTAPGIMLLAVECLVVSVRLHTHTQTKYDTHCLAS